MEHSRIGSSSSLTDFFRVGQKPEDKVHDVTRKHQRLTPLGKDREVKSPVGRTDFPAKTFASFGEQKIQIPAYLQTAHGIHLFEQLESAYNQTCYRNGAFTNQASVVCFNEFLDILSRKLTYYTEKPAKGIELLNKAITAVKGFSAPGKAEIVHCLKVKTLVLYVTPEAGDAIILESFLKLGKNAGLEKQHQFDNVFKQLQNLVLVNNSDAAFAAPLNAALKLWKENSDYRYTYGFPNTACMLHCLDIDVSGRAHAVRKQVRRFDKFVQKMMDCHKQFYAVMQSEDYDSMAKIPAVIFENVKRISVRMTNSISDAGLLLNDSNFKLVLEQFDGVFGDFINRFSSSVENKSHKQLIADQMLCYLNELPDDLEAELQKTQHIGNEKDRLDAVYKAFNEKLYTKAIELYDQVLYNVGGHFQTVTLLGTPVVQAEEKNTEWVNTLKTYLSGRDKQFKGEASNQFEARVNVRTILIKETLELLQDASQKVSEIQQNIFYQPLVLKLMDKMRQDIAVVTDMITPEETDNNEHLLKVFRTCKHCIGSFIPAVKDEFGLAFIASFQQLTGKRLVKGISDTPAAQEATAQGETAESEYQLLIGSTGSASAEHHGSERTEQETLQMVQTFFKACQEQPGLEKVTFERVQKCKDMLDVMLSTNGNKTILAGKNTLSDMLRLSEEKESPESPYFKPNMSEMTAAQVDAKLKGTKMRRLGSTIKEFLLGVNVTRDTLVPVEKIQRKDLIQMTNEAKSNLKFLCQAAMQKTKLALDDFSGVDKDRFIAQMDFNINNVDNVADLKVLDPFIWFCNSLKEACQQKQSELIAKIERLHEKNLTRCAAYFEENYYGKDGITWQKRAKDCHQELKTFRDLVKAELPDPDQTGDFICRAIEVFAENMNAVYQTSLADTLPPSLETVLMQQRVFSLSMSTRNSARNTDDGYYNQFETIVRKHNLHVKSVAEHYAHLFNRTNHPEKSEHGQALDKAYHAGMVMARDDALQKLGDAIQVLSEHKEGRDLLMSLHKAAQDLENSGIYNKCLKPLQAQMMKFYHGLVDLCIKHDEFVTGGFVLGVMIIFIYQVEATEVMSGNQKASEKLLSITGAIRSIFDQMVGTCPELGNATTTLRSLPASVAVDRLADNASCYADIYRQRGSSLNATMSEAFGQMEMTFVSLFSGLFYLVNDCPKGGYDSFIPGMIMNPGNFLLTLASITTGIFTMRGWSSAVDTFNREALTYRSLPAAAHGFSPDVVEGLMAEAKKYVSAQGVSERASMYAPATPLDSLLDGMDTCFHKEVSCTPWGPCNSITNSLVDTLRYFSMMQGCSMAVSPRVHSLEEMRGRLLRAATMRKWGTRIRMVPYNFSKEFMDVIKTVGGTLVYLIVLKEVDIPVAFNEKANICNYERIKVQHEKLLECLQVIADGQNFNSYQKAHLDAIYGKDFIDALFGENVDLEAVKGQAMIEASRWIRQISGTAFVGLTVAGEVANKYLYTYSPYTMAKKAVEFMSEERPLNSSAEKAYQKLLDKAKKTIRKEIDPSALSDEDLLVHYLSAGRSLEKTTSSFLHWGLKEIINISMYLNGTAAERSLGISSLNWNLFGLVIAYLVKDSTGMFARVAMLFEQEELRTLFSLADKLDSPFAEWFHHKIGSFGLVVSQHLMNLVEPVIRERYQFHNGDLNKLHQSLADLAKHVDSRGLQSILHATKVEEDVIQKTMQEDVLPWADAHQEALRGQRLAVNTAGFAGRPDVVMKPRPLEQLRISLLEQLKRVSVFHGKQLSSEDRKKLTELEKILEDVREGNRGIDISKASDALQLLFGMAKDLPEDVINAYIEKHILRPFHVLPAAESVQERIQRFSDDILNPHKKQTVPDMPSTSSGSVTRQPSVIRRHLTSLGARRATISEVRLSAAPVDEEESVV